MAVAGALERGAALRVAAGCQPALSSRISPLKLCGGLFGALMFRKAFYPEFLVVLCGVQQASAGHMGQTGQALAQPCRVALGLGLRDRIVER